MTVYKVQGESLGKVIVELAGTEKPGESYVALSRARTLGGVDGDGNPIGMIIQGVVGDARILAMNVPFPDAFNVPTVTRKLERMRDATNTRMGA